MPDRPFEQGDQPPHRPGVDLRNGDGQRVPAILRQGRPRPQQKPVQKIARRHPRLHGQPRASRFQDANEDREEIRHPIPQLLHIRVLVGGALVAIHRQSLLDPPPLQVELLPQGFHHQLLQIPAEEQQPVLVRQHHHIARAPSVRRHMP